MSAIEQKLDQESFEQILEGIFKNLEEGVMLTFEEIGDLRYACGLPQKKYPNNFLKDMFSDMGKSFTTNK